ncbi:MAG: TonB-dependent receptor, partial [Sphingomonadales bacterium]
IDEVDIKGFEFSATAAMHEFLTISGGINVIDSEIKRFASRPETVGNKSPYTPDYTINASADFHFPVVDGITFTARADVQWIGDTWFHAVQNQNRQTLNGPLIELFFCPALGGFPGCDAGLGLGNFALTKRDNYMTLDLRVGFEGENWSLIAFARNLTKERYLEEVIPAPEFGGSFIHPASLRTLGIELGYRF